MGWSANLRHLNSWTEWLSHAGEIRTDDTFTGDNTSPRNQSFANAAHHLGNWTHYYFAGGPNDEGPEQLRLGGKGLLMDASWARQIILAIRLAAACLLLPMGFRLGRADDVLGRAAGFGLACVATLVISPVARAHYFVLVFPAVIFLSLWLVAAGSPAGGPVLGDRAGNARHRALQRDSRRGASRPAGFGHDAVVLLGDGHADPRARSDGSRATFGTRNAATFRHARSPAGGLRLPLMGLASVCAGCHARAWRACNRRVTILTRQHACVGASMAPNLAISRCRAPSCRAGPCGPPGRESRSS